MTWAFAHGGIETGQAALPADGRAAHRAARRVRGRGARGGPAVPARRSGGPRSRSSSPRTRCAGGASRRSATSGAPASSSCPACALVRRGPYRWLSHPNYVAVAVEGAALPLVHTAWVTALAFTVLNAVLLLGFRIPTEERALRLRQPGARHDARRRPARHRRRAGRARRGDRGTARGAVRHRRRAARDARRQGVRRGPHAGRRRGARPARRRPRRVTR